MTNFFQTISTKFSAFIAVIIISITSILPWSTSNKGGQIDTPIATPSASESPITTSSPKAQNKAINKATTIPVVTGDQRSKADSAVGIEQCKTYAKEKRKTEETKVNEEYARSEPGKVELSNTQNNGQTETVALKYGYMTEKDIVRSADVYLQFINEGYPTDTASSMAQNMLTTYSAYLRSLHDWATDEMSKWGALVKTKFDSYENEVYENCLNSI